MLGESTLWDARQGLALISEQDAATHLAEEVHHPERAIPLAIMGTVCIGFVT